MGRRRLTPSRRLYSVCEWRWVNISAPGPSWPHYRGRAHPPARQASAVFRAGDGALHRVRASYTCAAPAQGGTVLTTLPGSVAQGPPRRLRQRVCLRRRRRGGARQREHLAGHRRARRHGRSSSARTPASRTTAPSTPTGTAGSGPTQPSATTCSATPTASADSSSSAARAIVQRRRHRRLLHRRQRRRGAGGHGGPSALHGHGHAGTVRGAAGAAPRRAHQGRAAGLRREGPEVPAEPPAGA